MKSYIQNLKLSENNQRGEKMNQPSIKRNYIYRLFYEMLAILTPLITAPYISRVLGADGVGIYSYTSSIMAYFTMFAALGTQSYGAREVAMHRDDKESVSRIFWEIELLCFFTTIICIVAWIILIALTPAYRPYFWALLPSLFSVMVNIAWLFTGFEKIKCIVIRNSVCKIVGVVLLFLLIKNKSDLVLYIVITTMIDFLGNLSMWTYLPGMICKIKVRTLNITRHIKQNLIYFVPTIAISIYTILDKTLIGLITKSAYENGYYEQATKIMNIVKNAAINSLNSVMGARIAYLYAEQKMEEIHERIKRSLDFILLIGYAFAFGILSVARDFVPIFFGSGYDPVIMLLYLMSPLVVIIGISSCVGAQYLTPCGKQKLAGNLLIVGAMVNLCINLILIPKFGANGATIATICAETLITILFVRASDHNVDFRMIIQLSWKRIIAGIIMMIVVIWGRIYLLRLSSVMMMILEGLMGGTVYIIALFILKDNLLRNLMRMVIERTKIILRRGKND